MPKISVVVPVYNLEKYLYNMLDSLKKQSFHDFEAIIIDDGSSDGSYEIISEFVDEDNRFKAFRQDNKGVSAARNRGMDLAIGEYIIFFDGDDYIPVNALKSMYLYIKQYDCDMTVGIMMTYDSGILSTNAATKRLAEKKSIDVWDIDFVKTWSQCNKMYKLGFLRENDVRFIDVKVAEDGHFLYQVLSAAGKICGCNDTVYHYIRRSIWDGKATASKNVDIQYLYDRIRVYSDIMRSAESFLLDRSETEKVTYVDTLVSRFINGGMIQAFYKRIWRCEKNIDLTLNKYIASYKELLSDKAWDDILHKNWEINLKKRLSQENEVPDFREDIINAPIITIAVSDELNKDELDLSVAGFYNQEFPSFELILSADSYNNLDSELKKFENIRVIEEKITGIKNVLAIAGGRYIYCATDPVILNTNSLKKMADKLEDDTALDFVSVYAEGFNRDVLLQNGEAGYKLKCMETVFGYTDKGKRGRSKLNVIDNSFSNKLFRTDFVRKVNFEVGDLDMGIIYDNMRFEKSRATKVMIAVDDKLLIQRVGNDVNRVKLQALYMENKIMGLFAGKGIRKKIKRLFS